MSKFDYPQFLRDLRANNTYREQTAVDCAESNQWLDAAIAQSKMDPGAEETKKGLETYDRLRAAALDGSRFTYPAEAESFRGIAGETVDAMAEVSRIYIDRVNNFAVAMGWAMDFFEEVNLGPTDQPYYQNETSMAVRVALIGTDGGVRNRYVVKEQSQQQVLLYMLSSEKVKWRLFDLLRGPVAEENKKLVDIARDVMLNLDGRLATALATAAGSFNFTTGSGEKKTLNLHPTIDSANLPTTNIISLTSAGGVNKSVLDAVFKHFAKFGNIFSDGDLYPVAFYYPSKYALSMIGDVTLTTAGTPQAAQNADLAGQVLSRGYIEQILGRTVAYRPLANLSGKYVYVRTNKPVGKLYRKKSADKMVMKEDEESNEGSAQAKIAWGAVIPEPSRIHMVRVQVEA